MKSFNRINKSRAKKLALIASVGAMTLAYTHGAFAADDVPTLGTLAGNIKKTFQDIAELMIGIAYVAGVGFFIASIFKFKQHKDNPTQIPMGTPIALLMIAVCLVFMPYIIQTSGATFIGGDTKAYTAGVGGTQGVPGLEQ